MPTQIETVPQWQTYLDRDEDVKPYLNMQPGKIADDSKIQMYVDMACQWVQNYLGRPIAPTEFFRRFSGYWATGNGGAQINLPYYPVLSVASVVEYWGSSGPHTLVEQTPQAQGTQDVYAMDYIHGYVIRAFMGLVPRPFFPGLRNVEITWTAGYNPLPADIKIATLELVQYYWRNTQEAPRTSTLQADEYGSQGLGSLWPAIPNRVTTLLEPYVQLGIG